MKWDHLCVQSLVHLLLHLMIQPHIGTMMARLPGHQNHEPNKPLFNMHHSASGILLQLMHVWVLCSLGLLRRLSMRMFFNWSLAHWEHNPPPYVLSFVNYSNWSPTPLPGGIQIYTSATVSFRRGSQVVSKLNQAWDYSLIAQRGWTFVFIWQRHF